MTATTQAQGLQFCEIPDEAQLGILQYIKGQLKELGQEETFTFNLMCSSDVCYSVVG